MSNFGTEADPSADSVDWTSMVTLWTPENQNISSFHQVHSPLNLPLHHLPQHVTACSCCSLHTIQTRPECVRVCEAAWQTVVFGFSPRIVSVSNMWAACVWLDSIIVFSHTHTVSHCLTHTLRDRWQTSSQMSPNSVCVRRCHYIWRSAAH